LMSTRPRRNGRSDLMAKAAECLRCAPGRGHIQRDLMALCFASFTTLPEAMRRTGPVWHGQVQQSVVVGTVNRRGKIGVQGYRFTDIVERKV
jgi:hypothetical protein